MRSPYIEANSEGVCVLHEVKEGKIKNDLPTSSRQHNTIARNWNNWIRGQKRFLNATHKWPEMQNYYLLRWQWQMERNWTQTKQWEENSGDTGTGRRVLKASNNHYNDVSRWQISCQRNSCVSMNISWFNPLPWACNLPTNEWDGGMANRESCIRLPNRLLSALRSHFSHFHPPSEALCWSREPELFALCHTMIALFTLYFTFPGAATVTAIATNVCQSAWGSTNTHQLSEMYPYIVIVVTVMEEPYN